ncbi:hypothetical protein SBOR_9538 [Sclerotinia borealis F-4128]|uniref:Uncharacterized protein n=1 Tax=Sclerotinia borealis (strain F-4128) TaxID=1432307 RepID=W9C582_SCLBF|nr:hypothetical protein SBOR_9538 [Sclerotinia borealis F-4128]
MPSIDRNMNMNMTNAHDHNQGLENIEESIIKVEMQESDRRGSVATPAKSRAISRSKATLTTRDRPIASIEVDESYDPVTPAKSSARAGRGRARKRARSQSPKRAASTKVVADKISKTRQSPKKKDTKGSKNLRDELLGEMLAEDDDNGDEWEDDNDGVRSDENTWDQVNKVIGSTGKPTHPNGRAEGRKLVAWHRTRMMEKLILHIVFECRRAGINLPWDKIAHRLYPASSGAAAQQYINKMRDVLITEGHLVPPPLGKKAVFDPSIRGYIRDMDAGDPRTSRPVGWDEEIVDLKESLIVPGVSRGSGTYRRDKARWQSNKTTIAEETPTKILRARTHPDRQPSKPKPERKEKTVKIKKERSESLDPAEMPSDEDYDPGNRLKLKGYRKRKVKVKAERKCETDEDMDKATESEDASSGYSDNEIYLEETPSKKRGSENHAITPLAALPVKLKLSPGLLSRFPADVASSSAQGTLTVDDRVDDGESVKTPDDAETAVDSSARDGDDVFGSEYSSLDNNHNLQLRSLGLLPPNDYVGGINHGYGLYSPRGPLNASGYTPVYTPGFDSQGFANVGATSFENTHDNNVFSQGMYFGLHGFNAASDLNVGSTYGASNGMMQGMNGGHSGMRSFSHGTGVSSSNSSFAHGSTGTDYGGGAFDYGNASIAPGQRFQSPSESWVQEYTADTSFKQDHGL